MSQCALERIHALKRVTNARAALNKLAGARHQCTEPDFDGRLAELAAELAAAHAALAALPECGE